MSAISPAQRTLPTAAVAPTRSRRGVWLAAPRPDLGPDGVPRALSPLVGLLAVLLLTFRLLGRAAGRILWTYETMISAFSRVTARITTALLAKLGPLGRHLRTVLRPVLRGLRWLWHTAGTVFAALNDHWQPVVRCSARVAGLITQWLRITVTHLRPALRRIARRIQPLTRAAIAASRAAERSAARLGAVLRRAWTPIQQRAAHVSPPRTGLVDHDRPTQHEAHHPHQDD
jgi:hypothetical protein